VKQQWRYFSIMSAGAMLLSLLFCVYFAISYTRTEVILCFLATLWNLGMFALLVGLLEGVFYHPDEKESHHRGCLKACLCIFGKMVLLAIGAATVYFFFTPLKPSSVLALCLGVSTVVLSVTIVGGFFAITIKD